MTYRIYIITILIYKGGHQNKINLLGHNINNNTLNGLAIWSEHGTTRASIGGLHNLYYDSCGVLRSQIYPDKECHILSFTSNTLRVVCQDSYFNQLLNFSIKNTNIINYNNVKNFFYTGGNNFGNSVNKVF